MAAKRLLGEAIFVTLFPIIHICLLYCVNLFVNSNGIVNAAALNELDALPSSTNIVFSCPLFFNLTKYL